MMRITILGLCWIYQVTYLVMYVGAFRIPAERIFPSLWISVNRKNLAHVRNARKCVMMHLPAQVETKLIRENHGVQEFYHDFSIFIEDTDCFQV